MKLQTAHTLFAAALIGFAKAGWESPHGAYSYDAFCGASPHPPSGVKFVCLTTRGNALGFTAQSDFRGFLQPGNNNFVLYDGNPTTQTAVLENNDVHVTVMFNSGCTAVDVVDKDGNGIRNLCANGSTPVSIDP